MGSGGGSTETADGATAGAASSEAAAAAGAAPAEAAVGAGGFRKKPVVLLFMGMAGSGKTTLVQRLNLYLNEKVRWCLSGHVRACLLAPFVLHRRPLATRLSPDPLLTT